ARLRLWETGFTGWGQTDVRHRTPRVHHAARRRGGRRATLFLAVSDDGEKPDSCSAAGLPKREESMTNCMSYGRSIALAGIFGLLTAGAAIAQAPPGFSPLDKSNPAASGQDTGLRPIPTPPTP